MTQSVIGALRVNLGMDSAQFTRGAQRVRGPLDALRGRFLAVAAAASAAGAAFSAMTVSAANTAREVARLSGVANAPMQAFQRWAAASKTVGIEQDKLADILKDVNDRVGDFLSTGGGPMADFFEKIAPRVGVTADQFARLSGPEALQLYVTSLEKAGASQQEMTFFMEALASDATLLLPLLRNNGAAMQALGDRASDLGAVMDRSTVEAFQRFNVALGGVGEVFIGLRNRIAQQVVPAITAIATAFTDAFRSGTVLRSIIDTLINNIDRLAVYVATAATAFGGMLVGSFVAARVAAMTLGGSLLFLRGALIRTGIGAVVVGAGELAFRFVELVRATGSFGAALGLLGDFAVDVWTRIGAAFGALSASLGVGWQSIRGSAALALQDIVDSAYLSVNAIIGVFVGAKNAIVETWSQIPMAVGDLVFQAANTVIDGMESMLNSAIERVDDFTGQIRGALEAIGIKTAFGEIGPIGLGDITNPFEGQAAEAGRQIAQAFSDAMSQDFTGGAPQALAAIAADAAISQAQMVELARSYTELARAPMQSVEALRTAMRGLGEEAGLTAAQTDTVVSALSNVATQVDGIGAHAPEKIKKVKTAVEKLDNSMSDIGKSIANTFASIVTGTAKAKDAIGQLLQQIAGMLAQKAFTSLLGGVFGGGGGGAGILGGLGSILGFANGTPSAPGGLAIVGERGPELVNLPRGSSVTDAQSTRQMLGGGEVAVRIDLGPDLEGRIISRADSNAVRIVQGQAPGIVRQSVAAVADTNRETGSYLGRAR